MCNSAIYAILRKFTLPHFHTSVSVCADVARMLRGG